MSKKSKLSPQKTRTFRNRFILYCWCSDWFSGQGSREYRLLCRLKFWLRVEFGSNARWLEYYEQNYKKSRSKKLYKNLVIKYITPKTKTEEDYATELFQLLKQTCHTTIRFCNWTLNLQELRACPPNDLRGYCFINYQNHNFSKDEDLHSICKDFVRMAFHSRQHQKDETSTEFTTE